MNPRVYVQVWCEVDPTLNLRVDRQTGIPMVEGGDQLMRVSHLGRFGITAALEIPDAEVIAYALGDGHEDALRHALAAGASRAVRLNLSDAANSSLLTAHGIGPLADWLAGQKPDLVIADRTAGRVAGRLGWAHLAGLDQLKISFPSDPHHLPLGKGERKRGCLLHAIRHLGKGDSESVTAILPAMVRLQTESPRLRYVSKARIARVSGPGFEESVLRTSSASRKDAEIGPLQISRPRTRLGAAPSAAAPVKAMDRLNALLGLSQAGTVAAPKAAEQTTKTPGQMAEEFVRYLRHHNLFN